MRTVITQKELELVKQYQAKPSDDIALYFFNKYKDEILNIISYKINSKFSSIPLERDDFFYTVWKGIKSSLATYKPECNKSLKTFFIDGSYFIALRETIKFLKNSHIILNNAYSYEGLLNEKPNFNFGANNTTTINNSFDITRDSFISTVVHLNKRFNIDELKRVIYLKSLGYSIKNIASKLRISVKKVNDIISYACNIAKNMYK